MVQDLSEHQRLVRALLKSERWPHAADRLGHIETHISSVLLVGPFAYKIKKPVDFGFLDFSTVELRRVSCEEEVRLNRRLAPDIYLEAMAITGTLDAPVLGGAGEPIEWAVKMRRFDEGLLLSAHPELLDRALMERLGREIAQFHARVNVSKPEDECGQPDLVVAPMRANFEQIRLLERGEHTLQRLQRLEEWTEAQFATLRPLLEARKLGGVVREGHGDLHLGNIAMDGANPIIFDGIEFSCALRCIDVMNDIAFLAMDLAHQQRPDLEAWFINAYVEESGDYSGLPLLRFYQVYRAMVRAKVATLRLSQIALPPEQIKPLHEEFDSYLGLADRLAQPAKGALIITHGVSGSGKTLVTGELLGPLHAIRVRSDVERKRLAGLAAADRSGSGLDAGLYTPSATLATYEHLAAAARAILDAGFVAVVDATFLQRDQRQMFAALARLAEVPFLILDFDAPPRTLRARVAERTAAGKDASEAGLAVLERQLQRREPLDDAELARTVSVAPDKPADAKQILGCFGDEACRRLRELGGSGRP
jgi:aminoglycoside phosphotransferase family enzyme/predicted kinase